MRSCKPGHWRGRRGASFVARALGAVLVPLTAAALTVGAASLPVSGEARFGRWWWPSLAGATVSALGFAWLLARSAQALGELLRVELRFPARPPSRVLLALRTTTQRQGVRLARRIAVQGVRGAPHDAARQLVTLVAALSVRDRRARGHAFRVRSYADLIARELKLTTHERTHLAWIALLHDVGEALTPNESHAVHTGRLVAPLAPWLRLPMGAAGDHHERWDGTGFPRRLARNEIPPAARIVALADAFDELTSVALSDRPEPIASARRRIARRSGWQYEPAVVGAFVKVPPRQLRRVAGGRARLRQLPGLGPIARGSVRRATAGLTPVMVGVLSFFPVSGQGPAGVVVAAAELSAIPRELAPPASSVITAVAIAPSTTNRAPSTIAPSTVAPPTPTTATTSSGSAAATSVATTRRGATTTRTAATTTTTTTTRKASDCSRAQTGVLELNGADLSGCRLDGRSLANARLAGANLTNASLIGADLSGADLTGATLSRASFDNANLTHAVFRHALADDASFSLASLSHARLDSMSAPGIVLRHARLDGVQASGAQWMGADLSGAILDGAVFVNASLAGSRLGGATVRGVDLSGANLMGAGGVPFEHAQALWSSTTCPSGLMRNSDCYG